MAERVFLGLEHAVGGEEAQDTIQSIRMSAYRLRQLSRRSRSFLQGVRDPEVRDDMQASRQYVPSRDLQYRDERIGVVYGASLASPARSVAGHVT